MFSSLKTGIKRVARSFGVNFSGTDHIGVDVELDLARLTLHDPLKCIFDVGGNYGQSASKFAQAFPQAIVHTFEPVPDSYRHLLATVDGESRIRPNNCAMGDKVGASQIHLTDNAESNSLLGNGGASEQGAIEIQVNTVDGYAAAQGIREIDFLKIDVEGYELQVFAGTEELLARQAIRYILVECVFAEDTQNPHTSFFDIHQKLAAYGFCFVACYSEAFMLKDGCALTNVLYALKSKLPAKAGGRVGNMR